ncbi:M56 family metallopeptidase [Myxococcus stipitatus]|uniref:M56 family metallopeptidase n=1 Tax=Myxococcus stipitatus TaxID=83455 RepID=UPI0022797E92|nr:M56 family metallopeptidase [Myxococcus stipitatus]
METAGMMDLSAWMASWAEGLWRASWQGALGAVLAWGLTRCWPRMPASLRAGLWWLVALKFVVALVGPRPVALPLLPSTRETGERPTLAVASAPEGMRPLVVTVAPEGTRPLVATAAPEGTRPLVATAAGAPAARDSARASAQARDVSPLARLRAIPRETWMGWCFLALSGAWLMGVLWRVREHLRGFTRMRALRRQARVLEHPALEMEMRALARAAGLRRVPGLLVSDAAPSPLATGLARPVVVLPSKAVRRLPVEGLRMALAHEVAHLRRGDLWLGWVPALAEALLFFHPLARRVAREYALAREEACDAEALRLTGAEPADYGELLLVFGVARPHGTAAALGASDHVHVLHRRLSMLEHVDVVSPPSRRWLKVALSALGLAALVPYQVVARPSEGDSRSAAAPSAKPEAPRSTKAAPVVATSAKPQATPASAAKSVERISPAASAAPSAPSTPSTPPVRATPSAVAVPSQPAAPSTPGTPPVRATPSAMAVPTAPSAPSTPSSWATLPTPPAPPPPHRLAMAPSVPTPPRPPRPPSISDDGFGYVLMVDENTATMSGTTTDLELARMFRKKNGPPLLFARLNGEAFIIRDEATLKAVRGTLESLRASGEEQSKLGKKMGELGEKMGALGQKMGELGMKQAALGMKQAEVGHEKSGLGLQRMRLGSLSEAERDRREAELDKQEEELDRQMEALGKQQEELGEQQEKLGEQQEKLGEQQEKLGEQQEKLSERFEEVNREAQKKVRAIVEEAISKGLGQPLPT